jgi:hypothetical protein
LKFKNQRVKIKMTTQNAKISGRSNRSVHHLNREERDSFTPQKAMTLPLVVARHNSAEAISVG